MGKIAQKECIGCTCADNTIRYSDWWYCTNPKDFRDFTVLRGGSYQRPIWCPARKEILITKEGKEKLISALLKSKEIKDVYKTYIIKEIPFETWVRNTSNRLLGE